MTTTLQPLSTDEQFVALAADIGRRAAEHEPEHDRDATFVAEAYDAMRETGYLGLAVPADLGGLGASWRQVVLAQHELARWSGSASLASAMHHYLTLVHRYRHHRGAPDAGATLRRIAGEGIVLATSGGSDWVSPTTTAVEVDGGYLFTGRKSFCSQAPGATVLATSAVLGEPGPGAEVLHAGVPFSSPGVSLVDTWDTLGMRGTASQDVVLDDVFVPAERVVGRRPYGELTGPLLVAVLHFAPVIAGVYLGVAQGAYDEALRLTASKTAPAAGAARQLGEMQSRLRVARWGVLGALEEVGEYPEAGPVALRTVLVAKRHAVLEAVAVTDLALQVAGGAAFYRRSPLERAYRDVRGGPFHPTPPEATLVEVGEAALAEARR
ncbi:acyl-CoA/acyl-ACP dehydrogenase [Geodermatophilus sp. YIM 151500]|uniref:acyl-CoA dehydrogenase family protein n=1 Tax=Geodermatophilus sp. YIM 151500 TaxID=2984531 RepID=UPI0021E44868|nr:acyl-CoA dehydrogenase family protein [Geodermatophilus sp. YIM 151500]MCV2490762.1 acyl-CoA/acyl-ACP dehydrogenase [Geodermatophilus sp. YIM 151500]